MICAGKELHTAEKLDSVDNLLQGTTASGKASLSDHYPPVDVIAVSPGDKTEEGGGSLTTELTLRKEVRGLLQFPSVPHSSVPVATQQHRFVFKPRRIAAQPPRVLCEYGPVLAPVEESALRFILQTSAAVRVQCIATDTLTHKK